MYPMNAKEGKMDGYMAGGFYSERVTLWILAGKNVTWNLPPKPDSLLTVLRTETLHHCRNSP